MSGRRLIVESGWMMAPDGSVLRDTALVIEGGRVAGIEPRSTVGGVEADERLGGPECVVLPGFVNAHQHGRPDDTVALGVTDSPLECWLVDLFALATEDPYDQTLRHAAQLAASGITTVVHMHSGYPATAEAYDQELRAILSGYRDGGIRVVLAAGLRDRGVPVYGDTGVFLAGLPASVRSEVPQRVPVLPPVEGLLEVIDGLTASAAVGTLGDAAIIYGPAGPPWCSDGLLSQIGRASLHSDVRVHTHLLETRTERRFGDGQAGGAVAGLREAGLLHDRLFVAHGVWLDARDRATLAEARVSVVTNPSSNLRLHAGIAPVRELVAAGVNVALGTDNMTLGGGDEILQDARLLRALQRRSETDDADLAAASVLAMATRNGGTAIGRSDVGVLQPGAVGDAVVIELNDAGSAIDSGIDPLELILSLTRPHDIRAVVAGGRVLIRNGEPTVTAPRRSLQRPSSDARSWLETVKPFVRAHYDIATRAEDEQSTHGRPSSL
jgi:cytosine/adenosine deaminase-related metal-dependent hydrolase